jgi:ketosteroid isomerase-like protein
MLRTALAVLALFAAVVPCAAEDVQEWEAEVDVTMALPDDLVETIEAFYASIEGDDVESRIALVAEDMVMMPNHWTISRGLEPVSEILRASAEHVFKIRDREIVKADYSGDVAYTVNSYFYTWHAKGDEPQWHKTKNVHIWRRDAEGLWKLEVDIWNSDVPIAAFADE